MIAEATYLPAMIYGAGAQAAAGALSPYGNRGVAATPASGATEDAAFGARRRPTTAVTIDLTASQGRRHHATHRAVSSGVDTARAAVVSATPMVTYSDKATLVASDQTPRGLLINITV